MKDQNTLIQLLKEYSPANHWICTDDCNLFKKLFITQRGSTFHLKLRLSSYKDQNLISTKQQWGRYIGRLSWHLLEPKYKMKTAIENPNIIKIESKRSMKGIVKESKDLTKANIYSVNLKYPLESKVIYRLTTIQFANKWKIITLSKSKSIRPMKLSLKNLSMIMHQIN